MSLPYASRRVLVAAALVAAAVVTASTATGSPIPKLPDATPTASCDKGSLPETTQGRAPKSDLASGRYAQGYSCNAVQVSKSGTTGGFRVERYVDKAGNECA